MDPGKKEILKENLTALEELGFGIEVADNSKVKLTKVPHCDRIVLGKYYTQKIYRKMLCMKKLTKHDMAFNVIFFLGKVVFPIAKYSSEDLLNEVYYVNVEKIFPKIRMT